MASPPFNPNEALPGDTDVVATFPVAERAFRDIIESWLLFEHDRSGHHAIITDTTANRDGDTTWPVGGLFYNETLSKFQIVTSIGPVAWTTLGPEFPAATKMLFGQTTPPAGWTKESGAAYQDAAIRCTTGTVGPTGGTAAFETAFAARTILLANLPNVNLTAESNGAHTHTYNTPAGGFAGTADFPSNYAANPAGQNTGSNGAHTHNVPLGGSGTAMDFDVKFVDVTFAAKA